MDELLGNYGSQRNLIEHLMLEALLFQAQHKNREALVKLREALLLAEPEGYIALFADEGPAFIALLKNFQTSTPGRQANSLQTYVARILQYFAQVSPETLDSGTPTLSVVSPVSTSGCFFEPFLAKANGGSCGCWWRAVQRRYRPPTGP